MAGSVCGKGRSDAGIARSPVSHDTPSDSPRRGDLVGAIAGMYGAELSEGVQLVVFDLPILVQEMVFALWLIIRGFDPTVLGAQRGPVDASGMTLLDRQPEPAEPAVP